MSYLLQLPMTQTSMTCSAREALTQLRAAPTLSQALVTQALSPQAHKTLTLAPQALLTRALTPQGEMEMDLEVGPQDHQDQPGLTATSVSACTILLLSTLFSFTALFSSLCRECPFSTTTHRCLADSQYCLSFGGLPQRSLSFPVFIVAVCAQQFQHN